jgi:hypothetical protein
MIKRIVKPDEAIKKIRSSSPIIHSQPTPLGRVGQILDRGIKG